MAIQQSKPKLNKVGDVFESYVQVYLNGVTSGDVDTGLKRVFALAPIENNCPSGGHTLAVNEDLWGSNGGVNEQINGRAVTVVGTSGTYWTLISKGYE